VGYRILTELKYTIICVDADKSALNRVQQDLKSLQSHFHVLTCTDTVSAWKNIELLQQTGKELCLILYDYSTAGNISFLNELNENTFTRDSRKLLLTATKDSDTLIQAINHARLDYFISKPWHSDELLKVVIDQTTTHILSRENDKLFYAEVLDRKRIIDTLVEQKIEKINHGFLAFSLQNKEELSKKLFAKIRNYCECADCSGIYRSYQPGEVLLREGDTNENLWLITKGEVIQKKKGPDGKQQVALREQEGGMVGLMSLVSREKTFITCYAATKVETIMIHESVLERIIKEQKDFLVLFANYLLLQLHNRLKQSIQIKLRLQETLDHLDATQVKLVESAKMATLGQLVAGIAHELNNPVAAILRGSEHLQDNIPKIIAPPPAPHLTELGAMVLKNSMSVTPLSTAEIRARTKKATALFGSAQLAKKAVQFQLDDAVCFKKHFKPVANNLEKAVHYLDAFYQVGNFLRNIGICSERIASLVNGLKNYARQDSDTTSETDLHEGIEDTLVIFSNSLKHYELLKNYGNIPTIECFPAELNQVWTNLISNAIEATQGKGQLKIETRTAGKNSEGIDQIQVIIEDNGPGIPPDIKEKIFELNYTTKREGDFGLGIGLAICSQIIKRHNGHIQMVSEPGRFTRFTITLPVTNRMPTN
jgi:signal transduction histidine kinase